MLQNLTPTRVGVLAFGGLLGCGDDAPRTVDPAPAPNAAVSNTLAGGGSAGETAGGGVARRGGARPADTRNGSPGPWCARSGATEGDWVNAAAAVAVAYIAKTVEDCETSRLTAALGVDLQSDWKDYLLSYTLGLAECPLLFGPLDGGTRAFGPANMQAIGVERPPLGNDDVTTLVGYYSSEFGAAFELLPDEAEAVVAHLSEAALDQIDPAASHVLSACGALADAGD